MNPKDAVRCFGLSKMTAPHEMGKGGNPYKKILFVEFLEYIGRIAAEKYKDVDEPLYLKIEKILDQILPYINATRKPMIGSVDHGSMYYNKVEY
jgi:hypothetical protein